MGIGTSSPIAPLHVKGTTDGNLLVRAGSLAVGTLTGTALSSVNDAVSATTPLTFEGSEFNFVQSNAVKVKVDSSGNVGIGVAGKASSTILAVENASGYAPTLVLNQSGIGAASIAVPASENALQFNYWNGSLTEAMRIDSSGRVGIGTSAPSAKLHVNGGYSGAVNLETVYSYSQNNYAIKINGNPSTSGGYLGQYADVGGLEVGHGASYHGGSSTHKTDAYSTSAAFSRYHSGVISFFTNASLTAGATYFPTERMRIDSSGSVTANVDLRAPIFYDSNDTAYYVDPASTSNVKGFIFNSGTTLVQATPNIESLASNNTAGNVHYHATFCRNDGTVNGKITTNYYATTYSTTSDYRVKEDIQPMGSATADLMALNPINFQWVGSDIRTDGFLAHEVAAIVPDAVVGEKDSLDAKGNPDLQGLDQSKMVPLLVKTIQEQQAVIESLEARLTALENA